MRSQGLTEGHLSYDLVSGGYVLVLCGKTMVITGVLARQSLFWLCCSLLMFSSLTFSLVFSSSTVRNRRHKAVKAIGARSEKGVVLYAAGQGIFESSEGSSPTSVLKTRGGSDTTFGDSLKLNWLHGVCKHVNAFEGTQHIRKLRFVGDVMAIAMVDGRCCLVDMLSGDVIEKFRGHQKEIASLDFDGESLVTGGADGLLNMYHLSSKGGSNATSKVAGLGSVLYSHREHTRSITGAKIISRAKMQQLGLGANWGQKTDNLALDIQSDLLVSCSMDRQLIATDMVSGKVQWKAVLSTAPLCLDVTPDGAYVGMGMLDGSVQFYSVRTGKAVLSFQAHDSKVRSLQLQTTDVLFTGGHDGMVRLWDLAGGEEEITPKGVMDPPPPRRIIDFYFSEASEKVSEALSYQNGGGRRSAIGEGGVEEPASEEPEGVIRAYRFTNSRKTAPIVALQADEEKLVTAGEDGMCDVMNYSSISVCLLF